jgi:hypothetical protein
MFVGVLLGLLLASHVTLVACVHVPCDDACQEIQREGLVQLYNALDGPNWRLQKDWLSDQPHCSWEGITCCQDQALAYYDTLESCRDNAVISICLFSNGAKGTIPLGALEKLLDGLMYLDLRYNDLHGPLPAMITQADHMRWILADGNSFTGTLPESWSSLTNLTQLTLSHNQLTGELPLSYTKLSNLRAFSLNGNCIKGVFPVEFFTLREIEVSAEMRPSKRHAAAWAP